MTDQTYCCGQHAGRHRIAKSDLKRAASTIARAQISGRKITDTMKQSLGTAKRGVEFAQGNINEHLSVLADQVA